jgi:5'-methylthioadenosine phosphorylase
MKRPIAIIGGSGVKSLLKGEQKVLGTPYGPTPNMTLGEIDSRPVIFLPRHGEFHSSPPHKVNYRANLWGLKTLGVERIIATNAVGAIDQQLAPGEIVIPSDIVDFTKSRVGTFYDGAPVTHVDVSQPYCPREREILATSAASAGRAAPKDVVMAATEGPRYETPAEIKMLRTMGCHIVGMTGAPEAFLARELEMCYASISFVSNMAAGLQRTLSAREVEEKGRETSQVLNKILAGAVARMPESRKDCPCGSALSQAQLKKEVVEVPQ